jgi:DNA mismatch repair protein MSH6
VNYAESDDEDSEVFKPISSNLTSGRSSKRRKVITDDSDDEFGLDDATQAAFEEEGI